MEEKNHNAKSISEQKIDYRFEELNLRRTEIKLREKEIEFNILEAKRKNRFNISLILGLSVALIGVLGSITSSIIQGRNQDKIEERKLEKELILEAVEPNEYKRTKKNLQFLIEIGLLKDENNALRNLLEDSSGINEIPILGKVTSRAIQGIVKGENGKRIHNAKFYFGDVFLGETGKDGSYEFYLPEEVYGRNIAVVKDGYFTYANNSFLFMIGRPTRLDIELELKE